jgi:hypothetical protein
VVGFVDCIGPFPAACPESELPRAVGEFAEAVMGARRLMREDLPVRLGSRHLSLRLVDSLLQDLTWRGELSLASWPEAAT